MKKMIFVLFSGMTLLLAVGCSSGNNVTNDIGGKDPGHFQDLGRPEIETAVDSQVKDEVKPQDVVRDIQKDKVVDIQIDQVQPQPFAVKLTAPADEATNVKTPFTVSVTFNRAVRGKSILAANFYILGPDGKPISGTPSQPQKNVVVFTPTPSYKYMPASPYTVILTNNIMDENGYRLDGIYKFTFYTGIKGGMDKYKALAAKYSPIIYQAVDPSEPKADYLTRIDFDHDWNAHNNWLNLQMADSVPADVYYDCVETPSHYFIYYVYYHGLYNSDTKEYKHGNDMEGAMVVVAKYPKEHPIAVETYFQPGQTTEEMLSFVTNESKIVPDGTNKNKVSVNETFSQAQLFPAGHFLAYITAKADSGKDHESCLWILDNPTAPYCKLSAQIKLGLKTIKYVYSDGTEGRIKHGKDGFPVGGEVSYALRSVVTDLWTRRQKDGDKGLFTSSFQYWQVENDPKNSDNRPGAGITLARRFPDSVNEGISSMKGKPPWSWKWNHEFSTNPNLRTYETPMGMILLDPAYYFTKRHNIKGLYSPTKKTGFSLDYCFNPYLGIDNRGKNTDCLK